MRSQGCFREGTPHLVQASGPATSVMAVVCDTISKDFEVGDGSRFRALYDISLTLPAGQLVILSGPSGCGKTTLLSIIGGVLKATSGKVSIFGTELDHANARALTALRRSLIGFVFQQYNLLPALTARQNAAIPLIASGCARATALARAGELLRRLGMGPLLDSLPRQLSGGQQQRVAIARALVHQPQLVLCDEPTAALDADNGRVLMRLLRTVALAPDRCVVVVTHDNRITEFADSVIAMEDGRIISVTIGIRESDAKASRS